MSRRGSPYTFNNTFQSLAQLGFKDDLVGFFVLLSTPSISRNTTVFPTSGLNRRRAFFVDMIAAKDIQRTPAVAKAYRITGVALLDIIVYIIACGLASD